MDGPDADEVEIGFEGNELRVIGPKRGGGFFGKDHDLDVDVTLPTDSQLAVKTGSADITVDGQVAETRLKTGSGDITCDTFSGAASIDTERMSIISGRFGNSLHFCGVTRRPLVIKKRSRPG